MLGYSKDDLDEMIDATYLAMHYVPEGQTKLMEDLAGTNDFLQGLWTEGYFDQQPGTHAEDRDLRKRLRTP